MFTSRAGSHRTFITARGASLFPARTRVQRFIKPGFCISLSCRTNIPVALWRTSERDGASPLTLALSPPRGEGIHRACSDVRRRLRRDGSDKLPLPSERRGRG